MIDYIVAFVILQTPPTPTPQPDTTSINESIDGVTGVLDDLDASDISLSAIDAIATAPSSSAYIGLTIGYAKYIFTSPGEVFGIFSTLMTHMFIYVSIAFIWFSLFSIFNLVVVVIRFVAWIIKFIPFIG